MAWMDKASWKVTLLSLSGSDSFQGPQLVPLCPRPHVLPAAHRWGHSPGWAWPSSPPVPRPCLAAPAPWPWHSSAPPPWPSSPPLAGPCSGVAWSGSEQHHRGLRGWALPGGMGALPPMGPHTPSGVEGSSHSSCASERPPQVHPCSGPVLRSLWEPRDTFRRSLAVPCGYVWSVSSACSGALAEFTAPVSLVFLPTESSVTLLHSVFLCVCLSVSLTLSLFCIFHLLPTMKVQFSKCPSRSPMM